ncbi:hypothetical protein AB3S75_023431 [Citrus x aurantiifolia]
MKELVYADAHKLFCQCAFGGDHPDASRTELTDRAIKYAQGVPLALKVLGCHLCGRSEEVWESAMRKLEKIPHEEIQGVLKISYDSLDDSQKNVFLDIACFFEGEHRDEVTSFFDASGLEAKIELSVLEGKSLITCFHNHIRMHDLIRDMGREIVRNESIDHPGERSRLWYHKDIYEVLKNNSGTEKIKGIFLDMNKVNREIHMNSYAFSKMPNLRFLRIYGDENKCMVSHLEGVPFAEVRHLEWAQCPLKTLNICAEKLVSLRMPCSKVEQLWDDVQDLVNLKEIDLSGSESLTKLPDLSQAKNLKILMLGGCLSLMETRSSIQYLNKLEVLYLRKCESLTSLPMSIPFKDLMNFPSVTHYRIYTLELVKVGIKELPSSIECLSNLKKLYIVDCSKLESISSSIFKLKSVQSIEISNCSILKRFLEIPSCNIDGGIGIERLASCKLVLENCFSLQSLPSSLCTFKSLTSLEIIGCRNFKRLPDELGNLKALETLIVDGTAITEVPESLNQLALLFQLKLKNCSKLESISSSIFKLKSLQSIEIFNCSTFYWFTEIPSCNIDGGIGIERLASCKLVLEKFSRLWSLPSSLCVFKSLTSLEIIDCQNFMTSSLKHLVLSGNNLKRIPESLGLLSSLKHLVLSGNNLKRIPESLGLLSSLKHLVLSGNNLKRIPESLSQLSSLEYLQLSGNSLEGIPEYLRSLPSKLTSLNLSVDLKNCFKLDPNELSEIVKDGWMKQSFDGNIGIAKSMYFPGIKIPKWFRYQSMGSSVTLKTPPADFLSNKILVGFAFCIVVAFRASDYFEHQIRRKSRPSVFGNYEVLCDWKRKSQGNLDRRSLGIISYVESDHVFLGYYLLGSEDLSKRDDGDVSFCISTIYPEDCEVKQCGIHFVYAPGSKDKVKRKRKRKDEEPHTKRLKCS